LRSLQTKLWHPRSFFEAPSCAKVVRTAKAQRCIHTGLALLFDHGTGPFGELKRPQMPVRRWKPAYFLRFVLVLIPRGTAVPAGINFAPTPRGIWAIGPPGSAE